MQTLSCSLNPACVEALEAYLAEDETCAWAIDLDARGGNPVLCGYFTDAAEGEEAYARLRQAFPRLPAQPRQGEIVDRAWQDAYKAYLHPWSCADLHWIPVWLRESHILPEGAIPVYFDAGMAFGTGSHETTRLMARRLLDFKRTTGTDGFAAARIVDAGCGSGILAISAALLGGCHVCGFDCDLEAVRVSKENRVFNGLPETAIDFHQAGLTDGFCRAPYDCVLANIQADVLMAHSKALVDSVAPGGMLALSGILTREREQLSDCFNKTFANAGKGPAIMDSRTDGEWVDVCYTLSASDARRSSQSSHGRVIDSVMRNPG